MVKRSNGSSFRSDVVFSSSLTSTVATGAGAPGVPAAGGAWEGESKATQLFELAKGSAGVTEAPCGCGGVVVAAGDGAGGAATLGAGELKATHPFEEGDCDGWLGALERPPFGGGRAKGSADVAAAAEVTGAGAALGAGESKATQVVDAGGATGAGRPLAALVVVGGGAGAFSSTVSLATKRFVSKTFSTNLLIALSFLGIAKGEEERATRQLQRHGRAENSRGTGRARAPDLESERDLRRTGTEAHLPFLRLLDLFLSPRVQPILFSQSVSALLQCLDLIRSEGRVGYGLDPVPEAPENS